jgi:5-methylcytosine-specific restriction endonuclease McrA
MRIDEIGLLEFGHTILMAGVAYIGGGKVYLALFPDENADGLPVVNLDMNLDDWTRFLRQTDLLETQVLSKASDGTITKAIVRKSQRHISQGVAWEVYRRAKFSCEYCGNDHVPLTVDHLILWEHGGPSTKDNLLSSCKKCNKIRGNTPYAEWLEHPYYQKVSKNLDPAKRQANKALVETLGSIPRQVHQPTHR